MSIARKLMIGHPHVGPHDPTGSANPRWVHVGTPRWLVTDKACNIYVGVGSTVKKISPAGVISPTWGTTNTSDTRPYDIDRPTRTQECICVAIDSKENIYAVGIGSAWVTKFTPDGVANRAWACVSLQTVSGSGWSTAAVVVNPRTENASICIDAADNVYVANPIRGVVAKITPAGVVTDAWAKVSRTPSGVIADKHGNIIVVDGGVRKIHKIAPDGTVSLNIGACGTGASYMTEDSKDSIYIANVYDNTITQLTLAGAVTPVWAAVGHQPKGMCVDKDDNVYCVNARDNSISKCAQDGTVTDPWCGTGSTPRDMTIDNTGRIYVSSQMDGYVTRVL